MGGWREWGQLRQWVEAGLISADDAQEVDVTIDLLIECVKNGAISSALAHAIICALADDIASGWLEAQDDQRRMTS